MLCKKALPGLRGEIVCWPYKTKANTNQNQESKDRGGEGEAQTERERELYVSSVVFVIQTF